MASKLSSGRRWRSTELKGNDVNRFKEYCRDMHINFETSEVEYGYIHFEVLVSEEEENNANSFLENDCSSAREEAVFEAERLKVFNELKAFAKEKNVGDFIIFYEEGYGIQICQVNAFTGELHFETREIAQKAIDTIGKKRLKKYYFCV